MKTELLQVGTFAKVTHGEDKGRVGQVYEWIDLGGKGFIVKLADHTTKSCFEELLVLLEAA
jgi:hypothetical protein